MSANANSPALVASLFDRQKFLATQTTFIADAVLNGKLPFTLPGGDIGWAAGTQFNSHRHYGGEEIYVLDGVFEDEFGRYPAGTWIRSPHLSMHCPFSQEGCTILVKTGHLPVDESDQVLA